MSSLIEFEVEGTNGTVLVAVDKSPPGSSALRGGGQVVERASETIQAAVSRITPAAQSIIDAIEGLHRVPDVVTVQFGIELSSAAGAFIASVGANANFAVTLTWNQPEPRA